MKTKEFIEGIANGTFSKNDVIMQSAQFPDKEDLLWDLRLADKACLESTGKPQVTDEAQIARISNAIEWLSEVYENNSPGEAKATIEPDKTNAYPIPEEIANSERAMELLKKCQEAELLDENYQPKDGITRWQLKEIASNILWLCDIKTTPKWMPFERLWNRQNIDKVKDGNGNNRAFAKRKQQIDEIFDPYIRAKHETIRGNNHVKIR